MADTPKRVTGKQLLDQRGALIYQLLDVRGISARDLQKLIQAAEKCTSTNCGWGTYEAAQLILKFRRSLESTKR
jgi:hypothetical protein